MYQKIIKPSKVFRGLLFLCQACPGNQAHLVSGNNQPWDTLPTKAMVTLTSVEPTLPHEVRGYCSCVKRALVTRRVLYQKIISPDRCEVPTTLRRHCNGKAMLEMRVPARLLRCRVPRGCVENKLLPTLPRDVGVAVPVSSIPW